MILLEKIRKSCISVYWLVLSILVLELEIAGFSVATRISDEVMRHAEEQDVG